MSYQVLARKWRPKAFAEVVGQEHVTKSLINALNQERLHHAYLFTGTRGIGKTTLARIFAKCLNCETGLTAEPCGKCASCTEVDSGHFIDLIEVDAASRTKVEDTRELLDNVQYAPTHGRYKIYLIDEVHMLSGHSFNALLKTLEEPPPHVKFLLATTDPQKMPITVLSRCLQFNLKNIAAEKITEHLSDVLSKEQIEYEPAALSQLAKAADGSIRDALSLLDQAIAYGNNKVMTTDVNNMLGTIENDHLYGLLRALVEQDATKILTIINNLAEQAADFAGVLEQLISLLHQIAISQFKNDKNANELAKLFTPEDIQLYYQIALIGRRDLPLAPTTKSGFEMIMLRMLAFRPVTALESHAAIPNILTSSSSSSWKDLLAQLNISESTRAIAAHCSMEKIADDQVQLLLNPKHAPMLHDKHALRLKEAFTELFGKPIQVSIKISDGVTETPSAINKREQEAKQEQAEQIIKKNSNVGAILENFNATIIPGSIINNENSGEK
jgi:DNA polymerase-3 subunit gamma/tau